MTSTFRLHVTRTWEDGATVTVTDNISEDACATYANACVLYSVRVNVCDEHDAMRRALQDVSRWLAWYLDPRTDR